MLSAGGITFQLSTRAQTSTIPRELYFSLLAYFQVRLADIELHSHISRPPSASSIPLISKATFFDYVIVRHERYLASSRCHKVEDSLVAVRTSATPGDMWIGELRDIFSINQAGIGLHRLGRVRWFKPLDFETAGTIWDDLCV